MKICLQVKFWRNLATVTPLRSASSATPYVCFSYPWWRRMSTWSLSSNSACRARLMHWPTRPSWPTPASSRHPGHPQRSRESRREWTTDLVQIYLFYSFLRGQIINFRVLQVISEVFWVAESEFFGPWLKIWPRYLHSATQKRSNTIFILTIQSIQVTWLVQQKLQNYEIEWSTSWINISVLYRTFYRFSKIT